LLAGEKRKRISKEMIQSFLDDLAVLPVTLEQIPAGIVFDRIQSLSRKHGLTAYDAAYLDLALDNWRSPPWMRLWCARVRMRVRRQCGCDIFRNSRRQRAPGF
jgi:hypothetical protein